MPKREDIKKVLVIGSGPILDRQQNLTMQEHRLVEHFRKREWK